MPRNPNWTRDELILALDLYSKANYSNLRDNDPRVIELSEFLNKLPVHALEVRDSKFRNANGVGKKLGNFAAIDPDYPGRGLEARSHLDDEVWAEFWHDKKRLASTAQQIRDHYGQFSTPRTREEQTETWDSEEEFGEGKIITRAHKQRERNPKLVRAKKNQVLKQTGKLACEVCGFDFADTYGDLGKNFAESHHIVPVSQLKPEEKTRLTDLAIVCANCHRMLHRSKRQITMEELRRILTERRTPLV